MSKNVSESKLKWISWNDGPYILKNRFTICNYIPDDREILEFHYSDIITDIGMRNFCDGRFH